MGPKGLAGAGLFVFHKNYKSMNPIKNLLYKKTFIFTILALILIGGSFYWFAYRPTKIRHDCSWTKVTEPAKPAVTKEEAEASRLKYDGCKEREREDGNNPYGIKTTSFCDISLKQESPAIPKKVWYRKANKDEYNFCIHEKGL